MLTLAMAMVLTGLALPAQNYKLLPRKGSVVEKVPPWRQYTQQNPPPDKQYVFFDEAGAEYVVYFPESLKTGEADGGRTLSFRFRPQFIVEPHVSVSVSKDGNICVYEYSVENGSSASDAIRWFYVVAPTTETPMSVTHATWLPSRLNGVGRPVAPQSALVDNAELRDPRKMGRFISWTCSDRASPIKPGMSLGGFRVRSRGLPGITTAYAATGTALRTPFELPPEVMDQIVPLLAIENNYKTTVTIGPKYEVNSQSVSDMAQDYLRSVDHLIGNGWLSNSDYSQEMKRVLESVIKSGERGPIQFDAMPKNQLEDEIGSAMKLALGAPLP